VISTQILVICHLFFYFIRLEGTLNCL